MSEIKAFTDLHYSDVHERCVLDLFRPVKENAPLVLLIHGGGWTGGHRFQYQQTCLQLASAGFAAATIGYRLVPDAVWPEIAYDVLRGAAYVCQHAEGFGIDARRAVTWGSSAGGHLALAMQAKTQQWLEAGVVEQAPEIMGTVAQCPVVRVPYCTPPQPHHLRLINDHAKEELSPDQMPPKLFKSVLAVHGDADETIPLEHVSSFMQCLSKEGVDARLEVLPGVGHGYGYNLANEAAQQCLKLAIPYLKRLLA